MVEMSFDEIMRDVRARQMEGIEKAAKQEHGRDLSPDEYRPIMKSASECPDVGRRIASVGMMKSSSSGLSARPAATSSVNGGVVRPTLDSVRKSAASQVSSVTVTDMTSLKKAADKDWDEYNAFISNNE